MTKARFRFWLLTGLNILTVVTLLLFLLEDFPATRGLVSSGLLVLLILFLFLLIPLALLALFLLARNDAAAPSRGEMIYRRLSYGILVLGWLVFAIPALFWSAVYVAAKEPWPLSMQQGPDTDRGRAGFEMLFGFTAEGAVTDLYYYSFNVRDASYFMRFRFEDSSIIDRVAQARGLKQVPVEARDNMSLDLRAQRERFAWWIPDAINATDGIYVDDTTAEKFAGTLPQNSPTGGATVLWVDSNSGTAYYREMEF